MTKAQWLAEKETIFHLRDTCHWTFERIGWKYEVTRARLRQVYYELKESSS